MVVPALEALQGAIGLGAVEAEVLDGLAGTAREVSLAEGAVLDLAGESGDALYVVTAGTLEVHETMRDRVATVRTIVAGEALDDLQTLAGSLGTVTVRAVAE